MSHSPNENRLKEGMRIWSEHSLSDRVQLSSGIEEVKEINGMPCFQRAFLPKKPWTTPNAAEIATLQAKENENGDYQQFALLDVPKNIKDQFHALKLYSCRSFADAERICANPDYGKALNDFVAHFHAWHQGPEPEVPHQIFVGKPGLTTTTFNRHDNFWIGMHLDSFERKPMNERHIARNRICINLGLEPRYLMFINLEYRQMVKLAGFDENFINERHHHHYEALYKFYSMFPDYPVLKLRIDPYEAYLAPTENVVHDGSTEGTTEFDVNLAVRGYYQRGASLTPKRRSIFKFLTRK